MVRHYFGTDGIRGLANRVITPELALKVGQAAGMVFRNGEHRHRVLIGKDTRLSGYMIENALVAGFTSVGMDVLLTGPIPTPAVGMLARSMRADIGVMISASHNPFDDNGIKLFGPDGFKLSDEVEVEIEKLLDSDLSKRLAGARDLGRARRIDGVQDRYIEFAKLTLSKAISLEGVRVVIDCANGAAYKVAPAALWEMGADVVAIGVDPDGFNINKECGSTNLTAVCDKVREMRADIGIALDGDADRLIVADERGEILDGDQLMALIATSLARGGRLAGGALVATVMSNLGLERCLAGQGIGLHRTAVGDRYVVEKLRALGCNLGGEQSGHIILSDYATTGDGLIAALQVLAALVETGRRASEVCRVFAPVPQLLRNVRFGNGRPLESSRVRQAIAEAEARLRGAGRLVIRKSGTEPVIRVMAEGEDAALLTGLVEGICATILEAARGAEAVETPAGPAAQAAE